MSTKPNILVLMSDEHARRVMGAYGNSTVRTPNLDGLAAASTVFDAAYTPSPICVPARAALATGRDIHEIGCWDNAHPYEGTPVSWAHALRGAGFSVESIGKLHYRDAAQDTGFSRQTLPMHVAGGLGDLTGSVREPPPFRSGSRRLAENLGPGETEYTRYDRAVRDAAVARLRQAAEAGEEGLVLFVSFVAPHFPLVAPEEFYALYADTPLFPRQVKVDKAAQHPWLKALRQSYAYDNFNDARRQEALRSYYGLVSFLDDNLGQILSALKETGREEQTSVIYLSDHGDNLGERGMWGKSTFFEDSVGVPLMIRPAGTKSHTRCQTPVSLIDFMPTMLELAGIRSDNQNCHAHSLLQTANARYDPKRVIVSQYHAAGSPSGAYMLRQGHYKYIHYEGYSPQLFDLSRDAHETCDLANDPGSYGRLRDFDATLRNRIDPEMTNRDAFGDQQTLLNRYGGAASVLSDKGSFSATPVPRPY